MLLRMYLFDSTYMQSKTSSWEIDNVLITDLITHVLKKSQAMLLKDKH